MIERVGRYMKEEVAERFVEACAHNTKSQLR